MSYPIPSVDIEDVNPNQPEESSEDLDIVECMHCGEEVSSSLIGDEIVYLCKECGYSTF